MIFHTIRLTLGLLLFSGAAAAAATIECVNADPSGAAAFAAGAGRAKLSAARSTGLDRLPKILVWQADAAGTQLDQPRLEAIAEHVRRGNALLITLGRTPGSAAFRFTPLSPSSAWQSLMQLGHRGNAEPGIGTGEYDRAFFRKAPVFRTGYRWRLRPVHAAERGETRLECLERDIPYLKLPRKPGEAFHSRPLLNRNWKTRLRADDPAGESLLITGQYGAGRVALFASELNSGTPEFWADVLRYLAGAEPAGAEEPAIAGVEFTVDRDKRALLISAANPGKNALALPVVVRPSGWDGTLLDDLGGTLHLPPGGRGTLPLPLPAPGPLSPQLLDACDALQLRAAILTPAGDAILAETRLPADFTPEFSIRLSADELGEKRRTLPGPGPEQLRMEYRGGFRVSNYAYRPGETAKLTLELNRNFRNLAPLAICSGRMLNDRASSGMEPRDMIRDSAVWRGRKGETSRVTFRFPEPVRLSRIVLSGAHERRKELLNTPGALTLRADGREVYRNDRLDAAFRRLRAELDFKPAEAKEWVLEFPWSESGRRELRRVEPALTEIELYGAETPIPAGARSVDLTLRLLAPGSAPVIIASLPGLTAAPGGQLRREFAVRLPELPAHGIAPCRIEAVDGSGTVVAALPLLVIDPAAPLRNVLEARPVRDTFRVQAIVTRGVRSYFALGTGSRDTRGNWGEPEDKVYCYANRLKQVSRNGSIAPEKLFLTENDFSHYANPWGCFPNGQRFFEAAAPSLVALNRGTPAWEKAKTVDISNGDRWDTGPSLNSMYSMQEIVEFDRHLRRTGRRGLAGRTRRELLKEIERFHSHPFARRQLDNYLASFRSLRSAVEGEGKRMVMNAQGIPLLPPEAAAEIGECLSGMSDDDTWGALQEDFALTAGRQMIHQAFNPEWRLQANFVWGWDNTLLNNPHWYGPAGTTESSRRHQLVRGWRGTLRSDGSYGSMHTYGYGMNGYNSYVQTANDWQQNWNAAERQSLIGPDGAVGFALIVGTDFLSNPDKTIFSGGGMGDSREADELVRKLAGVIGKLHNAGLSIPCAANTANLAKSGERLPLILPMPSTLNDGELASVAGRVKDGEMLIVFTERRPLPPLLAPLFPDGAGDGRVSAGRHGIAVGIRPEELTEELAGEIVRAAYRDPRCRLRYPAGSAGYGFTSAGKTFLTVEDLAESARRVELRVRKSPGARSAAATGLNDHLPFAVRQENDEWIIEVPLRNGDGELVMLEELP